MTLLDTISDEDGFGAWVGQPVDRAQELEQQLDLDRVLTALPAGMIRLCAVLMADEPDPAGAAGLSRTTLHRRVHELRCLLLAAGAAPRRGTSASVAE